MDSTTTPLTTACTIETTLPAPAVKFSSTVGDPSAPSQGALFWLLIVFASALGFALICQAPHEVSDEGFHFPQIWNFYCGNGEIVPNVTQIPLYHVAMAQVSRLIGDFTLNQIRFINLIVSLAVIPLLLRTVRLVHGEQGYDRALLFFLLPATFPFFFVVYTDVWSLLLILAMFERTLSRQYLLGATFGLLAILMRQPNAVWVVVAAGVAALEGTAWSELPRKFLRVLARVWPYALVMLGFAVFIKVNGGISVGDRSNQQVAFNPTNFYYFLIATWVLLLPEMIQQFQAVLGWFQQHRWAIWLLPVGFVLFIATLKVQHTYNHPEMTHFLHNRFIHLVYGSLAMKTVGYIAAVWALVVILRTRMPDPRLYWLHLGAFLSIAPLPMVEQRYYLPAWMLFLVFRKSELRGRWLGVSLVGYAICSAWIMFGTARMSFFL